MVPSSRRVVVIARSDVLDDDDDGSAAARATATRAIPPPPRLRRRPPPRDERETDVAKSSDGRIIGMSDAEQRYRSENRGVAATATDVLAARWLRVSREVSSLELELAMSI